MTAAIALATTNPLRSTVRLLPGNYLANITVATGTIRLVGTGASIEAETPGGGGVLSVLRGADVTIRGLHFDLTRGAIYCGGGANPTDLGGTLRLRDLTVEPRNYHPLEMLGCTATARRVRFVGGDSRLWILKDGSSFDVDQVHFTRGVEPLLMGSSTSLTIKNSIFDNVWLLLDPQDTGTSTSRVVLAFNTIYTLSSIALYRQATATNLVLTVENNIFMSASPSSTSAVWCQAPAPACNLQNNIVFPQAMTLPASNVVMNPKLVDPTMGDMRLAPDSPALNAATANGLGATDHDFNGVMRPQGSAPDIGALELVP